MLAHIYNKERLNMWQSVIAWVRGLSIASKVVTGVATIGVAGAVATSTQAPTGATTQKTNTPTQAKVEAKTPIYTISEITETEEVAFQRKTENSSTLALGGTETKQVGIKGVRTLTYRVSYKDGVQTNKELANDAITTQPIDEIVSVGTYVAPAISTISNGATAMCSDGSLSYSAHRQGTCSHHGGVAIWY